MTTEVSYRPYTPRSIVGHDSLAVGGWTFRFYHIDTEQGRPVSQELLDACATIIGRNISRMDELPNRQAGFVILHRDDEDVWLNLYWWTYDSILSRLIFRADPRNELDFSECSEPYLSCIWELVPVQHERDAWVKHMLGRDGSLAAYLAQPQLLGQH